MIASAFCPFRLLGDFSLVISFPILLSRILFSKDGSDGVSLTTQVFHFLVFVARYLDIFLPSWNYSRTLLTWNQWFRLWYNPSIKAYLLLISFAVILAIAYRATNKESSPWKAKAVKLSKSLVIYILPAFSLAYRFSYLGPFNSYGDPASSFFGDMIKLHQAQWIEILWSFSHFLAAVADIPQYQKYYNYLIERKSHDWWLMSSLLATFNFRHFYIPHWIIRFQVEGTSDPISVVCAVVQIVIFWVFLAMCNSRIKKTTRSLPTIDEETPVVDGEKDVKH